MARTITIDGKDWRFVADPDTREMFYVCLARPGELAGYELPDWLATELMKANVTFNREAPLEKWRPITRVEMCWLLNLKPWEPAFPTVYIKANPGFWKLFLSCLGQPTYLMKMTDPRAFIEEVRSYATYDFYFALQAIGRDTRLRRIFGEYGTRPALAQWN